jgi:hypothetical protein
MDIQPSIERQKIVCRREEQATDGFVERREFTASERMTRGLKVGGILWGAALLTIPVPGLHFILPPIFLLAGIVFGWAAWHDKAQILGGEFKCPSCQTVNKVDPRSEAFPFTTRCSYCQLTLELVRG